MKEIVQVNLSSSEFNEAHEEQLNEVISQVEDIVPRNSKLQGRITGAKGQYEGRIHIKTKIGAFVAKARSRNVFELITQLQGKLMRQLVNWRERRASKKRYQRRRHFKLIETPATK